MHLRSNGDIIGHAPLGYKPGDTRAEKYEKVHLPEKNKVGQSFQYGSGDILAHKDGTSARTRHPGPVNTDTQAMMDKKGANSGPSQLNFGADGVHLRNSGDIIGLRDQGRGTARDARNQSPMQGKGPVVGKPGTVSLSPSLCLPCTVSLSPSLSLSLFAFN
jgi:hypothetical protein